MHVHTCTLVPEVSWGEAKPGHSEEGSETWGAQSTALSILSPAWEFWNKGMCVFGSCQEVEKSN